MILHSRRVPISTNGKDHIQVLLRKENTPVEQQQTEAVIAGRGYIIIADKQGGFSIRRCKERFWGNLNYICLKNPGNPTP